MTVNAKSGRVQTAARRLMSTRIEKSGTRLKLIACGFVTLYCVIGGRLIYFGFKPDPQSLRTAAVEQSSGARPEIVDRNGEVMATDVKTMSVFAEPRRIIDKDEATELITAVLPDLDAKELREKLGSRKGFVWIKRQITSKQQNDIYHLGLPGVGFWPENKRVYPNGPIAAHVLGFANIDNIGIAGIEKFIDGQGLAELHGAGFHLTHETLQPVALSLDIRATQAVRDELQKGMEHFHAKAAGAAIMDVNTGEMIAYTSLPDYDPNNPVDALDPNHINRLNVGVYEMGSTFKAITIAMALEANKVNLNSRLDARGALHSGRFAIHDYHGQNRSLTVPEVFTYSSNIGTARMALMVGVEGHKAFLRKMGAARTPAYGTAGKRRADRAPGLGRAQHDDHRVRPRSGGCAAASHDGGQRARERGHVDQADVPEAYRWGREGECAARRAAGGQRVDALHHAPQRGNRQCPQDQHSRLFRRRQDRHGREGRGRPLFQDEGLHDVHGDRAGRQAPLPVHDGDGRAAGGAGNARVHHRRVELGLCDRQDHLPCRTDSRTAAALRVSADAVPPSGKARLRHGEHAGEQGPRGRLMRLRDLLPSASAPSDLLARDVTGLSADSRKVVPGSVFFAVSGAKTDGLSFADEAVRRGAVAIVTDRLPMRDLGAPIIQVADVRAELALAVARLHPRQPGTIAAITGTSGKTSVAAFLRQIWRACGRSAASLGTIGLVTPDGDVYGSLTTPDPETLHETLDRIAGEGVTHLAMEASSHGLDQRRLDGVRLAAAGFTNLSRDHLDYHPDLENYLEAKLRLFSALLPADRVAVIDADSDVADKVEAAARGHGARVFTVGNRGCDIIVVEARPDALATALTLDHDGVRYCVRLPLAGAFQVSNALVAAGLAISTGERGADVFPALETLQGAPGRLERVGVRDGAGIFIDYAHKPDALAKVLETLRPLVRRRLVLVFGCGGDRDRGKRPIMGEIAADGADVVVVTDDNPRSEDPAMIRREILAGMRAGTAEVMEIGDRRAAIEYAIGQLGEGDILLVAGKGHETGQIVGSVVLPFSDARGGSIRTHDAQRGCHMTLKEGAP